MLEGLNGIVLCADAIAGEFLLQSTGKLGDFGVGRRIAVEAVGKTIVPRWGCAVAIALQHREQLPASLKGSSKEAGVPYVGNAATNRFRRWRRC